MTDILEIFRILKALHASCVDYRPDIATQINSICNEFNKDASENFLLIILSNLELEAGTDSELASLIEATKLAILGDSSIFWELTYRFNGLR